MAGRLLLEGGKFVATDRLGSAVYKFSQGLAVVNGGMETGVSPWYAYNGAQAEISYVPHTGGRSLRVTTPIVDRGVYQEVKNLVPGMSYQFQAWVRAESGTNLAALAVCDSNYTGFVWTGVRTATTDWQLLSVTFTATGQGVARVHLAKHDTTGALLWDDVELVNGANVISGVKMRYHPYGQEVGTATGNDVTKFGTYTRDSGSGLDYAMNRYYMSTWGRFTTADPYRASGGPANPSSWNRYAYVGGDPVNWGDPSGLNLRAPYPPGYCPAQYDVWECTTLGFFDSGLMDGGGGGGGGGGYDACQTGPGFLPGPGCMMPIVVAPPQGPSAPRCCLSVRSRPLNLSGSNGSSPVGIHSYVTAWVQNGATPSIFGSLRFVIEGYEKEGKLIINTGALSNNGTFFTEGKQEGPTVCGGPEFCLSLAKLRTWAADYNQSPQDYDSLDGPNCHSVVFTSLVIAGVTGYGFSLNQFRPTPVIFAPGWGIFVQPSNLGEP